ncbi:hypothetical protein [Corynebacterium cystitidis]|uniref:hypothetical protein n=1 Tax=Corynebacterium cystitidis TaxID=35757 RepID=UPI00211E186A|nr:hypothetical protein [Corynebacterium cystitidis]
MVTGILGLIVTLIATTSITLWISYSIGGKNTMHTGYLVRHGIVSGWMALAALVLLNLTPVKGITSLRVGAVLAAAAVFKLVFLTCKQ